MSEGYNQCPECGETKVNKLYLADCVECHCQKCGHYWEVEIEE